MSAEASLPWGPKPLAIEDLEARLNHPVSWARGRSRRLSLPRRFVGDLMHFSRKVPSVPLQRRMRLADVASARSTWPSRVSWCAIFMKAYSILAAERPALRRSYLAFPWPRVYEHPENVASFSVERSYRGEDAVFFARVTRPESLALGDLDSIVRAHKAAEVHRVNSFRHALWLSSLPRPVRRLVWWLGLSTDGMHRAHHFGTFGISVVAQFGGASLHLLSPLTTTLNYGPFEADHALDVRITYDHRVLDGATVARAITALEETLHGPIRAELLAHGEPSARSDRAA